MIYWLQLFHFVLFTVIAHFDPDFHQSTSSFEYLRPRSDLIRSEAEQFDDIIEDVKDRACDDEFSFLKRNQHQFRSRVGASYQAELPTFSENMDGSDIRVSEAAAEYDPFPSLLSQSKSSNGNFLHHEHPQAGLSWNPDMISDADLESYLYHSRVIIEKLKNRLVLRDEKGSELPSTTGGSIFIAGSFVFMKSVCPSFILEVLHDW